MNPTDLQFLIIPLFLVLLVYLYIRFKKYPKNLSRYFKKELSIPNADAKAIAEKLKASGKYIKIKQEENRVFCQSKADLLRWGNMYVLDIKDSGITLYYRPSYFGSPHYKSMNRFVEQLEKMAG